MFSPLPAKGRVWMRQFLGVSPVGLALRIEEKDLVEAVLLFLYNNPLLFELGSLLQWEPKYRLTPPNGCVLPNSGLRCWPFFSFSLQVVMIECWRVDWQNLARNSRAVEYGWISMWERRGGWQRRNPNIKKWGEFWEGCKTYVIQIFPGANHTGKWNHLVLASSNSSPFIQQR